MAIKKGAGLAKGTRLTDYANPTRIKKAFNNDEKAIRAEYSRQRSIIRKRIDRLKKAGEVYNEFYERFGKLDKALPSLKNLSTEQAMRLMSSSASALAGGYQTTLSEIKAERKDILETLAMQAEAAGDTKTAEMLRGNVTSSQYEKMRRLMGMINHAGVTRFIPSEKAWQYTANVILSNEASASLLDLAGQLLDKLGIDFKNKEMFIESMKQTFTKKGTVRADYRKARQKRGS